MLVKRFLPQSVVIYYKRLVGPGGAERQVVEECKYLSQSGVSVTILTHQLNPSAIFDLKTSYIDILPDGDPWVRIKALRQKLHVLCPDVISLHSGRIDVFLANLGLGIPYIVHHNSPVLLHHGEEPTIAYSWLHRKAFREIRTWSHGSRHHVRPVRHLGLKARIKTEAKALLNLLSLRSARLVVVLSRLTAKELKILYGIDAAVIRGCLSPSILSYQPKNDVRQALGLRDKRVVLSVSRLSFEKRVDLLLRSFKQVCQGRDDVVLIIGGQGPQEGELRALASALDIADKVHFVGFIPDDQLWDYYAMCDVFATPAWADFDITPYEALALGRPVVWSTEMETEPWVLASGLIVEADPTVERFAEGIERALAIQVRTPLDLSSYTWESKFRRLYQVLFAPTGKTTFNRGHAGTPCPANGRPRRSGGTR